MRRRIFVGPWEHGTPRGHAFSVRSPLEIRIAFVFSSDLPEIRIIDIFVLFSFRFFRHLSLMTLVVGRVFGVGNVSNIDAGAGKLAGAIFG